MNGENIKDGQAYEVYTSQKELEKIQKEFSDEMLVSSIIKEVENGNSSAQPILIDTSWLNRQKLQDYIAISKEIEYQEQLNKSHRRLNNPTLLEATMTHEEVFECSFESHRFLNALEEDNLFGPRQITDLDASQSIENALQYFNENVNADSGPSRGATPTNLPCTGTVTAENTSLKTQKSKSFGSPPPPYQDLVSPKSSCEKAEPEVPTSITKELRNQYEQHVVEKQKPQKKTHKSKDQCKSASPVLSTTMPKSQKSPNLPRKSKVKQLIQMFNSKSSQLMCTPQKYSNRGVIGIGVSNNIIPPPEGTLQYPIQSVIDLGCEAGSNDRESPNRTVTPVIVPKKIRSASPLFVKLTSELDKSRQQKNPFSFSSTPANGMQNLPLQIFSSNTARSIQQQSISPICAVNGGRRRLWHADDSRQNSPAMHVICEDRPLEQVELTKTPNSPIITESSFLVTTFNLNKTNNTEQTDKLSKFWVCAVDITISLEVFYNPPDRLCLLHEIFSQKSCEGHDLNFGIDDHKFSIRNSIEKTDISARLPAVKGCSHYWFSTGELAVPFKGKCLASEKIRRLFNFIKDSVTDIMRLRFGVDDYEFSRVPENKENSNRFSMASGYSMLAGPYGNSNGVEKCSPATSGYVSANSNYLKTSKLNFSGNDSKVDPKNIRHTPESSCGTKYYDVVSENSRNVSLSHNSNATANDSFHNEKFDIETLEKLFEDDAKSLDVKKDEPNLTLTISEVIKNLQKINIDLKDLEKRMKIYSNHSGIASAIIPHSEESPLYMKKLRIITSAINSLVSENGFTECSKEQLQDSMSFLAHYADICLESCNKHLINVLDALVHHHQEDINKTNNELALTKVNGNELKKP